MWCLQLRRRKTDLATEFEVFRYYDLKARIKGNIYIYDLPRKSYEGILKNEFQIKICAFLYINKRSTKAFLRFDYAIFAIMKTAIKQIYLFLLALSLILILADCGFIDNNFFQRHTFILSECADQPNHLEQNQTIGLEEDVLMSELIPPMNYRLGRADFIVPIQVVFHNNYIIHIWQPPQLS